MSSIFGCSRGVVEVVDMLVVVAMPEKLVLVVIVAVLALVVGMSN